MKEHALDNDDKSIIPAEDAAQALCEAIGVPLMAIPVAKLMLNVWNNHQNARVLRLLKNVGQEFKLGDSEEDWEELKGRIDEPRMHATVIEAARHAIDAFDEAAIPYIARVVSWHMASEEEPLTKRKMKWLLKLLAECDDSLLRAIKHLLNNTLEYWESETPTVTVVNEKKEGSNEAYLRGECPQGTIRLRRAEALRRLQDPQFHRPSPTHCRAL